MVRLRPPVDFVNVDTNWCLFCMRNRHRDCELHINDGAVDALDFVPVRCDCPCKGRVYGRLIDLVQELNEQIAAHQEDQKRWYDRERVLEKQVLSTRDAVEQLLTYGYDDEGNVSDRHMEHFLADVKRIFDEG